MTRNCLVCWEASRLITQTRVLGRWVKKLSSKKLTELERKGLEHGLKFAVAPNRILTAEIVASVEVGIFHLNHKTLAAPTHERSGQGCSIDR